MENQIIEKLAEKNVSIDNQKADELIETCNNLKELNGNMYKDIQRLNKNIEELEKVIKQQSKQIAEHEKKR